MADELAPPYDELARALGEFLPPQRLLTDPLRRLAWGTDASFYRLIPQIVAVVESESDVIGLLEQCRRFKVPLTFRAAGTSLSGQAISDSVLAVLGDGWRGLRVERDGERMALGPGVIGSQANAFLLPYQRKIGPDPASIDAAKIGGIAANNASGMCCGTAQNSYQTLDGLRLVLADGAVVDTDDPDSIAAFRESHREMLEGLDALARRTREDTALAERIRAKFKLKNTTGYSLNALVDFEDPLDILCHLMIGSEGTLGFLSEVRYRTVPDHPHKATALMLFDTLDAAARGVSAMKGSPVAAVELIDRAGLRSAQGKPGMPGGIAALPDEGAALLVEVRAAEREALEADIQAVTEALAGIDTAEPVAFQHDPAECARLWAVRKGLFPSVGAMREAGTTVIIEDVAFPVPRLAEATRALQELFEKHGYHQAIIFGHALEGNLHFVFTQDFNDAAEVARYEGFMAEVASLVVERFDGSLKAEHGTGRNMAPFVEKEWGPQAVGLMKEIKALLDPEMRLNPGVILNDDPEIHLKHLKPMPAADALVDKCIECGFCEPRCPSQGLTFSPRQRIVAYREISRLEAAGETAAAIELRRHYDYPGIDTCAGDGLCSTSCPVGINTGVLMKRLRAPRHGRFARWLGDTIANHYAGTSQAMRLGLGVADLAHRVIGPRTMQGLSRGARRLTGGATPQWTPSMPRPARPALRPANGSGTPVVYFPACPSRAMGASRLDPETTEPLPDVVIRLLERAGYRVVIPEGVQGLCCGMPFESKGLFPAADRKTGELAAALQRASEGGKHPMLTDTSPCAWRFHAADSQGLEMSDLTSFLHDHVLPKLEVTPQERSLAVHATCSDRKFGTLEKLRTLAQACATTATVPPRVECCGFAGDKGFTTPELNAHALRFLPEGIPRGCHSGVSTSRTCEIGLSHHGGVPYRSIAYLLEEASRGG